MAMQICGFTTFKWRCVCLQYGSHRDQAIVLKQQMILPLMWISNQLSTRMNVNNVNRNGNTQSIFQQKVTDTFYNFNLAKNHKATYRASMEYLTFSQMEIEDDCGVDLPSASVNMQSNVNMMNGLKKRKKRPLDPSIDAVTGTNVKYKKRKLSVRNDDESNSDDDVLRGLMGRENELQMNDDKYDEMTTLDASQLEKEEMEKRKALKAELERKKNDKKRLAKKKKKKKKIRI